LSWKMKPGGGGEDRTFPFKCLLLWIVAVAMGIPFILLILVHLPFVQDRAFGTLIRVVESRTDLKIDVEECEWRPFSRIRLQNLRVRSFEKEIFECDRAEVRYRLSFGRPYLHPVAIHLSRPVIHVEKDVKGRCQVLSRVTPREDAPHGYSHRNWFGWLGLTQFQVNVTSGTIRGYQDGQGFLSIRDINGTLFFKAENLDNGLRIMVDLPEWPLGPWKKRL